MESDSFSFRLAHELSMNGVSFLLVVKNIQWFSAKAVLINFFIGANSQEGVHLAFAFKFQMDVRLQGLHSVNEIRQDNISKMV